MTTRHLIPPATGAKEVLKVNVYERSISLNCMLAPLFPYLGPGAIVVTAALQRGIPGKQYGQFFHENSQEEISFIAASNMAMMPLGSVMCGAKFHAVSAALSDNQNPDSFLLLLIVQRQEDVGAHPSEQYEGFHLHCQSCEQPLLREIYNADPTTPEKHGTREGDRYPMFSTLWGCSTGAQRFKEDEALRTCTKCGHVNEPFPFETWGWNDWVAQNRIANDAAASMVAANASHLATAGATR